MGARPRDLSAGERVSEPPVCKMVSGGSPATPPWVTGRIKRGSARRALCWSLATFVELARTPGPAEAVRPVSAWGRAHRTGRPGCGPS